MTMPKLRFREFTDEWRTGRLGNFANFSNTRFPADKLNSQNYVGVDNLLQGGGKVDSSLERFANSVPEFRDGDSLFSNIRPYLKKFYFAKNIGGASPDVLVFRPDFAKICPEFLFAIISSDKFNDFVMSGAKGVKMPRGDKMQMMSYKLKIPSLAEQQKIAKFLSAVDARIDAASRKLELLRDYKTAVSQKIFARSIRFPGFSDEWQNIKISDIFQITRGNVLPVSQTKSEPDEIYKYPVYSSQTKNSGLMGYYDKFLYENAITWTTDGANAGEVNFREGKFYCTNVCGVLLNNEGFANEMVAEILNSVSRKYVSYVGNPKLMNSVMGEIEILVPLIDEQQKIASFLSFLDDKTVAESDIISEMKQFKKALLQRMMI